MAPSTSESELSAPPSDSEFSSNPGAGVSDKSARPAKSRKGLGPEPNQKKRKAGQPGTAVSKRARTSAGTGTEEIDDLGRTSTLPATPAKHTRAGLRVASAHTRTTHTEIKVETIEGSEDTVVLPGERGSAQKTTKSRTKVDVKAEEQTEEQEKPEGAKTTKVKRKRKTKEEKEAEMVPLAQRTVGSKLFIGAHVSSAGGVHNAVVNSVHIGGNAFALFLKSQRKWANPPLIEEHCTSFLHNCDGHKYDASRHVVPHGSYLVNLCHPDPERTKQAYDAFIDDLSRCRKLGIKLYNFHPGNSAGADNREQAIGHLASNLNKAHADPASGSVVTLLETMATRGNTIGGTFEDLRDTIELIAAKDRVGVCLDTCHVYAAGYDISTPAGLASTLDHFDSTVGLRYLRALHVNDSKAPLASHRDLHANIGTGFLGLRAFHALVNEPRLWELPMVLETPIDVKGEDGKEVQDKSIWAKEIKLMERMVGMDTTDEDFVKMEESLAAQGRAERDRIADQVKRRDEKAKSPKKKRGKKKEEELESGSDE